MKRKKRPQRSMISLRLPTDLLDSLEKTARRRNVRKTWLVERGLRAELAVK